MAHGLESLDRWLTGGGLAAMRWSGALSFRLQGWVRSGVAQAHASTLRGGMRLGLAYAGESRIADARRVPPVTFALYPSPVLLGNAAAVPPEVEGRSWLDPPDWNGSIAEQFLFHCLHPAAAHLAVYRNDADPTRLKRAAEIAARWLEQCLFRERPEAIWDEHIGAMRALVLCELWEAIRASGGGAQPSDEGARPSDALLVSGLVRHAIKLEPEAAYRREHNHGVTQAYGLLACALALGGAGRARSWIDLALARLRRQMAENVSPEGILREHSPYYHFFVFRQHLYAQRLARARGIDLGAAYTTRLHAMIEAGAHMLKPDGALVAAGDGARSSPVLVDPTDLDGFPRSAADHFRHRASRGREGEPAKPPRLIAPDGGFAFLGSDPAPGAPPSDAWHLALRLATFPTTHIHHDALSFELYAEGNDLLADSGGPYGYGNPIRAEYFVRTRAHSTVTVDDLDQGVGPCRILRSESVPGFDVLDVSHSLYSGVLHRRLTVFAPPSFVLVVDWMESETQHNFRHWLHFAPGLDVSREDLAIVAKRSDGGPGLRVVPLGPEGQTLELERGNEAPRQGWACVGDLAMVPRWAARYERRGDHARFATLLVPERADRRRDVRATFATRSAGEVDASIEVDGRSCRIVIAEGSPVRLEVAP